MPDDDSANLAESLNGLAPKAKTPASARVLNAWVAQAEARLNTAGPRLGWLVSATVVTAALQRAMDEHGSPLFLLKGGTMLQYRLPGMSRTTKDVDGLVRGEVETIEVPHRIVKPRRFDITVQLNGVTWRRVQIEVSPDEGHAGAVPETIRAPSLAGFGLPSPGTLASLSMAYQIAQKVHACTDPHDPPASVNDRARDVVDLLLLRDLIIATGQPTLSDVRTAIEDVFTARATDANAVGAPIRTWPTSSTAYPHWERSFAGAAESAGLTVALVDAVDQLNVWLDLIAHA